MWFLRFAVSCVHEYYLYQNCSNNWLWKVSHQTDFALRCEEIAIDFEQVLWLAIWRKKVTKTNKDQSCDMVQNLRKWNKKSYGKHYQIVPDRQRCNFQHTKLRLFNWMTSKKWNLLSSPKPKSVVDCFK